MIFKLDGKVFVLLLLKFGLPILLLFNIGCRDDDIVGLVLALAYGFIDDLHN